MPSDSGQSEIPELKEKQLNVAITAEMAATLAEIKAHHRYLAPQVARGLLEEACKFYDKHKWFGFPVRFEADVTKIPAQLVVRVPQPYPASGGGDRMVNESDGPGKLADDEAKKRKRRR